MWAFLLPTSRATVRDFGPHQPVLTISIKTNGQTLSFPPRYFVYKNILRPRCFAAALFPLSAIIIIIAAKNTRLVYTSSQSLSEISSSRYPKQRESNEKHVFMLKLLEIFFLLRRIHFFSVVSTIQKSWRMLFGVPPEKIHGSPTYITVLNDDDVLSIYVLRKTSK
jgi:hypothetical protein